MITPRTRLIDGVGNLLTVALDGAGGLETLFMRNAAQFDRLGILHLHTIHEREHGL